MTLFEQSGATFSPCRTYRYHLWRAWSDAPRAVFLMLNPSTADETVNDPTVERCERRARNGGYGGLVVVNLFALRSTDPAALYEHADPVGPDNDEHIAKSCQNAGIVVCAWGTHGKHAKRADYVRSLLYYFDVVTHCLGENKDGSPKHPLYVGYAVEPHEWRFI